MPGNIYGCESGAVAGYVASDVSKEGIQFSRPHTADEMLMQFADLWNSTIKKSELDHYGWDANPWVRVIEFERCEKPEREGK